MKFATLPIDEAEGTLLAHSRTLPGGKLSKGKVLSADDIARLDAAGITRITVAQLDPGDVGENDAATRIAALLQTDGLSATTAFTGRVNLVADSAGLVRINADIINRINAVDEGVTVATLPDYARVDPGKLVATVKIIPYAVPAAALEQACSQIDAPGLTLAPFRAGNARVILTRTAGMKPSLLDRAEQAVGLRLSGLGIVMEPPVIVDHNADALTEALRAPGGGDLTLILGASATSDRADVVPAAITAAGGHVARFGMPVDPGNLLVLGDLDGSPVLGLPGCVRSPALNGADWVMERLAAGFTVTGGDIATMGVGGLLKEVPARPQPRKGRKRTPAPMPEVILLAAGASRRMGGQDKLLRKVDGVPLLRRAAQTALASKAGRLHVVLPPDADARRDALAGLDIDPVEAVDWQEGMAASLRAGLRAVSPNCPAVIVALADMPDVTPDHFNALLAAFDVDEGREICRALSASGVPGHPVLFGRRFFEPLADLTGDAGARAVIATHADFVADVATNGDGAVTDLDTPDAWERWEQGRT